MLLQACAWTEIVRFVVIGDVTEAILPYFRDLSVLA